MRARRDHRWTRPPAAVVVATRDGYVQAFSPAGNPALVLRRARAPYLAAPGIGDGRSFVGGIDGQLVALDAARPATAAGEYFYKEEMGSQPLVEDGVVYVATLEGTVLALDEKTGAWKWHFRRSPRRASPSWASVARSSRTGVLYQGFADGSVVALDAKNGAVKWDRRVGRGDYPDVNASVQSGRTGSTSRATPDRSRASTRRTAT